MSDEDFDELVNDLDIEDIVSVPDNNKKKKKVDGRAKGNRTERNLCKRLSKHFNEEFSRALGSGSRWSQVNHLPEHAKKTLVGDICAPDNFKWVIECKGGYESEVNLNNILDGKVPKLDEFIDQVQRDSDYCGRKPIILWKRSRKPWIAFLKTKDIIKEKQFTNRLYYGDWVGVSLNELLDATPRSFWIEEGEK